MKTIVVAGGLLGLGAAADGLRAQESRWPANQDTVTYQVTEKVAKLQVKNDSGEPS